MTQAILPSQIASLSLPVSQKAQALPAFNSLRVQEPSIYRHIFSASDLRQEFSKFLNTIFFQLDEKKVFAFMDKLLLDPHKSDEQIYKELLAHIDHLKKPLPFISRLKSLFVLKKGMGLQAHQLLAQFNPQAFNDYLEIYDRRYVKTLQKMANLPLKGQVIAACDSSEKDLNASIQAGSLFSKFPYKTHIALNDSDCTDPLMEPEKTHRPLHELAENSIDLVSCLGGLHHVPKERVEAFASSLVKALRPGGVMLFRDHDCKNPTITKIASLVHSFVNAADGVSYEIEQGEIREFKSLEDWTRLLEGLGLERVSTSSHVLKDDPTENAMIAFVKKASNLDELKIATAYINNYKRSFVSPRATMIEWCNVRYSQSYAQFLQNHHGYSFDFIGHIKQHYSQFKLFITECRKEKSVSFSDLFFKEDLPMAFFILATSTIQLLISHVTALPSRAIARIQFGTQWREVTSLTPLEKFEALEEKKYADFILHTPFYQYPWLNRMAQMWKTALTAKEGFFAKACTLTSCVFKSVNLIATSLVSLPLILIFGRLAPAPEVIHMIIKDPDNNLDKVIKKCRFAQNASVKTLMSTACGHKLLEVPRYRPMTDFLKQASKEPSIELIELASQTKIPVDVIHKGKLPRAKGARALHSDHIIHDASNKKLSSFEVEAKDLLKFIKQTGKHKIDYIHE